MNGERQTGRRVSIRTTKTIAFHNRTVHLQLRYTSSAFVAQNGRRTAHLSLSLDPAMDRLSRQVTAPHQRGRSECPCNSQVADSLTVWISPRRAGQRWSL